MLYIHTVHTHCTYILYIHPVCTESLSPHPQWQHAELPPRTPPRLTSIARRATTRVDRSVFQREPPHRIRGSRELEPKGTIPMLLLLLDHLTQDTGAVSPTHHGDGDSHRNQPHTAGSRRHGGGSSETATATALLLLYPRYPI